MKTRTKAAILLFGILFFSGWSSLLAAQSLALEYIRHQVIPENTEGLKRIGGLSGITYNPAHNAFVTCADKPPSRLIRFTRQHGSSPMAPSEITLLSPELISISELEGIARDPTNKWYYVSDEQDDGTRIFRLDSAGRFHDIVLPKNQPLLPLSGHNSGIEGLTLSGDDKKLYFAFSGFYQ